MKKAKIAELRNHLSRYLEYVRAGGSVLVLDRDRPVARVIPLDRRPHPPSALRSYMGDPRGRWEGDTLVVETTNFNGKTGSYGRNGNGNPTSESLRLVERFTPVDANTLQYHVTVHDPQTWVSDWSVAFPMTRDDSYAMYEYACHEGNYALANSLRGARARERAR